MRREAWSISVSTFNFLHHKTEGHFRSEKVDTEMGEAVTLQARPPATGTYGPQTWQRGLSAQRGVNPFKLWRDRGSVRRALGGHGLCWVLKAHFFTCGQRIKNTKRLQSTDGTAHGFLHGEGIRPFFPISLSHNSWPFTPINYR